MIVKVYLACTWMGWTRNLLYEKLRMDGGKLLRLLQLPNRVPSYSQLNKRIRSRQFERALMGILRGGAGRILRRMGREELRTTMMDLTNIPTTGREQDAPRGTDGKVWFWGYKLGLLTSQSGVVLGVALIKANRVERHATHRLLRTAQTTVQEVFGKIPIKYLLCDAGFAGEKTYEQAHRILKCRVLSPPRRQRMNLPSSSLCSDSRNGSANRLNCASRAISARSNAARSP